MRNEDALLHLEQGEAGEGFVSREEVAVIVSGKVGAASLTTPGAVSERCRHRSDSSTYWDLLFGYLAAVSCHHIYGNLP